MTFDSRYILFFPPTAPFSTLWLWKPKRCAARLILSSKMFKQAHKLYVRFRDLSSSASQWFVVRYFIVYWVFKADNWRGQKIVYAKGTSDVIARLRGTYNIPVSAPGQTSNVSTDLQKSIFSGPPGSAALPPNPSREPNGTAQGIKRPREEESDGEAPMDEDSDVPMEASSDED